MIVPPLPIAAASASASGAGHDPMFAGNDHMGIVWKSPAGAATRTLTIDLGADMAIDTLVLLGLTGAMPGWTLRVDVATAAQGSGFPAGSWIGTAAPLLAGAVMPQSGRGKALWTAPSAGGPPPGRYVRLTFAALANAAVTVARVVIGRRIVLARNFQFGAAFGVRDLGTADFSARGVLLRRFGARLRSIGLSFSHVHRDEAEGAMLPLLEAVGNTGTLALVTDPDPHEQRQNRIYYGLLAGDLGMVWARANGFECRANLVALDR